MAPRPGGEQRLAEVFVELADAAHAAGDEPALLSTVVDRCVELLDITVAGVALADDNGNLSRTAAAPALRLLGLALPAGPGPSADCYRTGAALRNVDRAAAAARWPGYAAAALAAGLTTITALPLRTRGQVLGVLVLLGERSLMPARLELGQALADATASAIATHRELRRGEVVQDQLQRALTSRVIIEQAKGILAERWQIRPEVAFQLLRDFARSRNRRVREVAADVVNGVENPFELRSAGSGGGGTTTRQR